MRIFFIFFPLFLFCTSCMETSTNQVSEPLDKISNDQVLAKKEKECDKGKEVLKKIEENKDSLSLNNLESGCSIDEKKESDLKF